MTGPIPNVRPGAMSGLAYEALTDDGSTVSDDQTEYEAAARLVAERTGIPLAHLLGPPVSDEQAAARLVEEEEPPHLPPADLPEIPDDVDPVEWVDASETSDVQAARVQALLDREATKPDEDRDDALVDVLVQQYGGTYSSTPDPAPAGGADAQADGESPPAT